MLTPEEAQRRRAVPAVPVDNPENGFGLYDPTTLVTGLEPRRVHRQPVTTAAWALLGDLQAQVSAQLETIVTYERAGVPRTERLADIDSPLAAPARLPAAERLPDKLPLWSHWVAWYEARPAALRDSDGLELVRAWWADQLRATRRFRTSPASQWIQAWADDLLGRSCEPDRRAERWTSGILDWLVLWAAPRPEAAAQWLLDASESALAALPLAARYAVDDEQARDNPPVSEYEHAFTRPCTHHCRLWPAAWSGERRLHWYRLLIWLGEPLACPAPAPPQTSRGGPIGKLLARLVAGEPPVAAPTKGPDCARRRPDFDVALAAFEAGALPAADLLDHLLGPRRGDRSRPGLWACTQRRLPAEMARIPGLRELADRVRERLLGIELARGDEPTAATTKLRHVDAFFGAPYLRRILVGLVKDGLRRPDWDDLSKAGSFYRLLTSCYPGEHDTIEGTAALLREAELPEQLLCDAAMLAPQWTAHLAATLGWEGFESAAWWLYAHTKDDRCFTASDLRQAWEARVAEYTALSSQDLLDGAVDVAWFQQAHALLGAARFKRLYQAAKHGSSGLGHTRARLFADVMTGRVTADELRPRVVEKRHQDALRALGLAALPAAGSQDAEVLSRYELIAEFARTSKQFGPQRRASEQRAAAIALDNLARTAGFPDPLRLQWAMEARAVADLKAGPVTVTVGDTSVALRIGPEGKAELTAAKAGKALKSVPSAVGKDPAVADLKARKASLDRAAARMKGALEQSMCRGDCYTGRELRGLLAHPLLAPLLVNLLWLGDGLAGYPTADGQALRNHAGSEQPLGPDAELRLAHPVDLLAGEQWHLWQRECFTAGRVQPFKQVFRELYTLTAEEQAADSGTRRYAGHLVKPRQAAALLAARGWVDDPEAGLRRTWHQEGLSACLILDDPLWMSADLPGLALEDVCFTARGAWRLVPPREVPPRIYSEAMRDLDLVVSVAHQDGVAAEASASAIELRAQLLRETCALLGLDNVRLDADYAWIDGHYGQYRVHLGYAVAHRVPGDLLLIVAAHTPPRSRLFLPFADDDQRTAEVLSVVLLLARDQQIKDPSLLAAIRR